MIGPVANVGGASFNRWLFDTSIRDVKVRGYARLLSGDSRAGMRIVPADKGRIVVRTAAEVICGG